jgi:hypothetical protein
VLYRVLPPAPVEGVAVRKKGQSFFLRQRGKEPGDLRVYVIQIAILPEVDLYRYVTEEAEIRSSIESFKIVEELIFGASFPEVQKKKCLSSTREPRPPL